MIFNNLYGYVNSLEGVLRNVVGLGYDDFEGFLFSEFFGDMGTFFTKKNYEKVFDKLLATYKIPQYKTKNLFVLLEQIDFILSHSPNRISWRVDWDDALWIPDLNERADFLWNQMLKLATSPQQLIPFLLLVWCFLGGSEAKEAEEQVDEVRELIIAALEPLTLSAFVYTLERERARQQTLKSAAGQLDSPPDSELEKRYLLSIELEGAPHYLLESDLVEVKSGRLYIRKAITATSQVSQALERQDLHPNPTNAAPKKKKTKRRTKKQGV